MSNLCSRRWAFTVSLSLIAVKTPKLIDINNYA